MLFLPRRSARVRDVEFPARATFPANFADADQWSPPSARRSIDDRQAAWSDTSPQICVLPRENLFRPAHYRARLRNAFAQELHRVLPPPVNPRRRFLRRGTEPGCAPEHSSTRAHFPANRSVQWLRWLPASAAPCVPGAPHACAETIPPTPEGRACVRAEAAILCSQRAAGKTGPREISPREFPPGDRGASR